MSLDVTNWSSLNIITLLPQAHVMPTKQEMCNFSHANALISVEQGKQTLILQHSSLTFLQSLANQSLVFQLTQFFLTANGSPSFSVQMGEALILPTKHCYYLIFSDWTLLFKIFNFLDIFFGKY